MICWSSSILFAPPLEVGNNKSLKCSMALPHGPQLLKSMAGKAAASSTDNASCPHKLSLHLKATFAFKYGAKRIVMGQSLPYFGNKHPFCSYFGVPGYQIFDYIHWVGLREKSQETTFILSSLGFSLTPILGNVRAGRLL